MGSGEVGGGGSVKWAIEFDESGPSNPKTFNRTDQANKPPDEVGKSKGHSGFFKVRLRFDSEIDRDQAYQSITKLGNDMIVMFVRASEDKADQIRIDW